VAIDDQVAAMCCFDTGTQLLQSAIERADLQIASRLERPLLGPQQGATQGLAEVAPKPMRHRR
jgi:hypothetical protein